MVSKSPGIPVYQGLKDRRINCGIVDSQVSCGVVVLQWLAETGWGLHLLCCSAVMLLFQQLKQRGALQRHKLGYLHITKHSCFFFHSPSKSCWELLLHTVYWNSRKKENLDKTLIWASFSYFKSNSTCADLNYTFTDTEQLINTN